MKILLWSLSYIISIIIAFITTHIVNVTVILFIIVIIVFHKFIIEGTVGYGSSGDIALDDLTLLDGNCKTVITQSKWNNIFSKLNVYKPVAMHDFCLLFVVFLGRMTVMFWNDPMFKIFMWHNLLNSSTSHSNFCKYFIKMYRQIYVSHVP